MGSGQVVSKRTKVDRTFAIALCASRLRKTRSAQRGFETANERIKAMSENLQWFASPPLRQAIVTRFHGPTDKRGKRVSARADAGTVIVSWHDELSVTENHTRAAATLAAKFGWARLATFTTRWHGGALPNGRGFAFVEVS
jgi:hypothetical protein